MRSRTCQNLIGLVLALAGPAFGQAQWQTLPRGFESISGNFITYAAVGLNYNGSGSQQAWQWVYDSLDFVHQGPIAITQISVRSASSVTSVTLPSLQISLGVATSDYTSLGLNLASNVSQSAVVRSGPLVVAPVLTGAWVPLNITSGYVFDPSNGRDFVVQLERCGGAEGFNIHSTTPIGVSPALGPIAANQIGNLVSCTSATSQFQSVGTAIIIRLDYMPICSIAPEWQVNQFGASLALNSRSGDACRPIRHTQSTSQTSAVSLNGASGFPFEVVVDLGPGVSVSNGALRSPAGQIINLDLDSPSLMFLNGLQWTQGLQPMTIGVASALPIVVSAQMAVVDPASSEGFTLSAAGTLEVVNCPANFAGPSQDDQAISVVTACVGGAGPASIPFYGTEFTRIEVSANGRVMFWRPSAAPSPHPNSPVQFAATDSPFVGAWADFNPSMGGNIVISLSSPDTIRVDYVAVPYEIPAGCTLSTYFPGLGWSCIQYSPPSPSLPNTFSIELNGDTGALTLLGLNGLTSSPPSPFNVPMMLGLSAGPLGGVDQGATTFSVGGTGSVPGRAMIYRYGPSGTLAPGVTTLQFVPNQMGGYDWTGS